MYLPSRFQKPNTPELFEELPLLPSAGSLCQLISRTKAQEALREENVESQDLLWYFKTLPQTLYNQSYFEIQNMPL